MKTKIWKGTLILLLLISVQFISKAELINIKVIGEGQPVLLIHGMSCNASVWDETVERYKSDYELHLVNIKGFGNNEYEESPNYLEQIKNELIAYCKENNLKNPIVIGHSMGGFLGLWMAAEDPQLFGKIISVDGIPYFPVLQMPGITPETAKPIVESMAKSMAAMDEAQRLNTQKMIVSTMIATEENREKVVKMGMESNPRVTGKAYGEMFITDIRPFMSNIKVPVLVFGSWAAYQNYGATKESVTFGFQQQLKDIPHAKLLVAEKAYHFVFYDEPEWFYAELDEFLSQN
ncbi:alpha/beta fold hydrolase [Shivajiella indica]|uniref:Alpha/beta fold hydrolase n=1 Tax=Shivajiella indica TaxID=872115 RepID=A0ABW5B8K9_9BACT